MSGIDFVADTNFLINLHEGHSSVIPFLDKTPVISVISEIELLGWHGINESHKRKLKELLQDCILFELTSDIRSIAISLRQKQKIKVPDSIIAATAIYLQLPVVTSDKGFRNIKGLELVLI
jgi:predicted nucleic acid-binding protein